ncbi:MAG: Fe-S cluster assembly protein SufD [Bacteroidetes bacterium]|nr:Fe-S cluster assembly protein SufD [Bacteroidota bacterium]
MIAEKTNTAQLIIDKITSSANKINFINDNVISKALIFIEKNGFPTHKNEDYKYCNIDSILKKEFKTIEQKFGEVNNLKEYKLPDALTLVVVNGKYSQSLSDKIILKGIHINSLSNLDDNGKTKITKIANVESDALIAFNTLFANEGFHLKITKNETLQFPIQIIYVNNSTSECIVNPRNIIELEENSEATIIEHYINIGNSKCFTNFVSEKYLANNSKLDCYTIQDENTNGYGVYTNQIEVSKNANYTNTTITLSGQLVRNNHNVVLANSNCEANLNGLFKINGNQIVDNHTLVDHQFPYCQSNELYKGIIDGKSTGVFNGKIFVRKDAQKTNAYQSSKNILLSDDATINTKPQLEIYADDVKCSHGTSTGKIEDDAMFYLHARGIGKESAKKLLLNAFAGEVIEKIQVESLKELIQTKLNLL